MTTNEVKPCPFCGSTMQSFGRDLRGKEREVVQTVRHPYNDEEQDWRKICPLSMLVFPVELWNQRPLPSAPLPGELQDALDVARSVENVYTAAGHSNMSRDDFALVTLARYIRSLPTPAESKEGE